MKRTSKIFAVLCVALCGTTAAHGASLRGGGRRAFDLGSVLGGGLGGTLGGLAGDALGDAVRGALVGTCVCLNGEDGLLCKESGTLSGDGGFTGACTSAKSKDACQGRRNLVNKNFCMWKPSDIAKSAPKVPDLFDPSSWGKPAGDTSSEEPAGKCECAHGSDGKDCKESSLFAGNGGYEADCHSADSKSVCHGRKNLANNGFCKWHPAPKPVVAPKPAEPSLPDWMNPANWGKKRALEAEDPRRTRAQNRGQQTRNELSSVRWNMRRDAIIRFKKMAVQMQNEGRSKAEIQAVLHPQFPGLRASIRALHKYLSGEGQFSNDDIAVEMNASFPKLRWANWLKHDDADAKQAKATLDAKEAAKAKAAADVKAKAVAAAKAVSTAQEKAAADAMRAWLEKTAAAARAQNAAVAKWFQKSGGFFG